jgi:hypothetical protein
MNVKMEVQWENKVGVNICTVHSRICNYTVAQGGLHMTHTDARTGLTLMTIKERK